MSLANRLRKLRLEKGLTQQQLAEPDFTHAYVSTIEAGRRTPSARAIAHFADKLDVHPEELRTGRPASASAQLMLDLQEARRLISDGSVDLARKNLVRIKRKAREYELLAIEYQATALTGAAYERTNELEKAIEAYEEAIDKAAPLSPVQISYAVAGKGRCLHFMRDTSFAIYFLDNYLTSLKRDGLTDPTAILQVAAPLVMAYVEAGMSDRASALAEEALALASDSDDLSAIAALYVNAANVHLSQGDFEMAIKELSRAEDLYTQLEFRIEIAVARVALGYVHSRGGRLAEARQVLTSAIEILREADEVFHLANAYCELGRVERTDGDNDAASAFLGTAISLLKNGDDVRILPWAYRELGICLTSSDPPTAEKNFGNAIDLYERAGDHKELAITHRFLGDLLKGQGREDACETYRLGLLHLGDG